MVAALAVVLAGYLAAAAFHLPQRGTELVVAGQSHGEAAEHSASGEAKPAARPPAVGHPPYWMVTPFALLLGAIAVLPLIPATEHWWESNLHRFYVAAGLAAITLLYYLTLHAQPLRVALARDRTSRCLRPAG